MKRLVFAVALAAGAVVFAEEAQKDQYDIRPEATSESAPTAVDWQNAHDAEIRAATEPDVLAAFVADAAAADALLSKIGPAYDGDPLVLTQIAAVTQWVMMPEPCWLCFWKPSPAKGRVVWNLALARKIAESKDDYIRTFCRQQLDLCEIKACK